METLTIINTVINRLQKSVPELDVFISEIDPLEYIPAANKVTVLLQYCGSTFTSLESTDAIVLKRTLKMAATVIVPKISEAINALDRIRDALGGIILPGCDRPLCPDNEKYLGENSGLCRYILELASSMPFIANQVSKDLPLLTVVNYKDETV
ncbi:Gp37 family protein [Enterobacter cloacae]|uniref:Gp37 family protein n=1 Tax=Enterobacter cloacae TaxID=550 RepID=UPI0029D87D25|nr:Gp37 family protein [Enterobacter cloacae]MDX7669433.1 Gp37 family protein [Enterobacter cloacae]